MTLLLFGVAVPLSAAGQTCPSGAVRPPLNGQSWAENAPKTLYIDPNLPPEIKDAVVQAGSAFSNQTGQPINILTPGSSDPGAATQDVIRFLNNPVGAPKNFALTRPIDFSQNGADTHKQLSASVSINIAATIPQPNSTAPADPVYQKGAPNDTQFLYDVVLHELGHVFGLNDAAAPVDPATGNANYALLPAGGSIMNGADGTNDQGPHGTSAALVPGGVMASSVQPCDVWQINIANQTVTPGDAGGGGGGPKKPPIVPVDTPPDDGAGAGGGCHTYQEWDESTNTLTSYSTC